MLAHCSSLVALGALLVPLVPCQTIWVVDSAGGPGTFPEIQPAIAAAQAGDTVVIVAQSGFYASFVLDKGLTLVGDPGPLYQVVRVGASTIDAVSPGEVAIVAALEYVPLTVTDCQGTVIVERTRRLFTARDNADLRLHGLRDVRFDVRLPGYGRFELVDAEVQQVTSNVLRQGVGTGAQFHLACPRLYGIDAYASPGFACSGAWDGETPLITAGPMEVILTGRRGTDYLSGTACDASLPCPGWYWGGPAMRCYSGLLRRSAVATYPGCSHFPTGLDLAGSIVVSPPRIEPSLLVTGVPRPGAVLLASVYGEAGDAVALGLGRAPTRAPMAGSPIPQLVAVEREFTLGTLSQSGEARVPLTIPAGTVPGTSYHFQASAVTPTGELRLSNSFTVVVQF